MHARTSITALAAITLLGGCATQEVAMTQHETIPGYTLGQRSVPRAPITLDEFELIKQTALFTEEDARYLRMSRAVLEPHVKELVGVWYGFVGSNPHLLASFSSPSTAEPDAEYLARVRARFEQWVLDTAAADYDQAWLDYQFEIGRRHHTIAKNLTDDADAEPIVRFRYMHPLMIPITTTIRPFLERSGHTPDEVDKMHAAWVKSVTMQATLWCEPYVGEGEF